MGRPSIHYSAHNQRVVQDFLLPRSVIDQLLQIEANRTLDRTEAEKSVDAILSAQPRHLTEQLDLPSFYSQLPFNTKWQIKEVIFDKQLSYHQKHEVIFDLITRLPSNERRFPEASDHAEGWDGHSRLFDSYNALKYSVSFTFKLRELREALSAEDADRILEALRNNSLTIEEKLSVVEKTMFKQGYEVLDRLFFSGVPIVDTEVRERFRRLWFDRPFWMGDADRPQPCLPTVHRSDGHEATSSDVTKQTTPAKPPSTTPATEFTTHASTESAAPQTTPLLLLSEGLQLLGSPQITTSTSSPTVSNKRNRAIKLDQIRELLKILRMEISRRYRN